MNEQTKIKHLYWRAGFGMKLTDYINNYSFTKVLDNLFRPQKNITPIRVLDESAPQLKDLMAMSRDERREFRKISRQKVKTLNVSWLKEMVNSRDQLREKMAFFWHGHFACRTHNAFHAQQYIHTLRKYALGKFEDLVLAIAKEPAMLQFLNNQQNRKRKPNENFARELMELFTIGRGNYTETDIKESARAFTGWGFNGTEFVFRERVHDFDEKQFMGQKGNFNGEDIIRVILENPKTAYFITKKIYRFFVNPKVDETRVQNLSKFFYDSKYDIEQLMRKIFQADWFYAQENIGARIKSPIELIAGLQRQLNMRFLTEEAPLFIQKLLGQLLLFPPNVAGWAGGRSWIDSSTLLSRLKLPEALFNAAEIGISTKTDGDVQVKDLVKRKLRRFQAEFDWSAMNKQFRGITNNKFLFDQISEFLLVTQTPDMSEYAQSLIKKGSDIEPFKLICVLQCSLPEYQLC